MCEPKRLTILWAYTTCCRAAFDFLPFESLNCSPTHSVPPSPSHSHPSSMCACMKQLSVRIVGWIFMVIDTRESNENLCSCFNFNLDLTALITTSCKDLQAFLHIHGTELNIYRSEKCLSQFIEK
jgi:hypothetical protein